MKVTQIVGEHKKGFKANIYRKKKVIAPQSTEIKPMEEDAKITRSDTSGVEITADTGIKTVLPADKATALAPDPQNPNEYDLNPAAVNPSASGTAGADGPKVGDSVEMKTAEDGSADADGPGYSFDSAKNFKDALSKTIGSADPEVNAHLDSLIVAEPDGTVDVDQTLYNMVKEFNQLLPHILQFTKDMLSVMITASQSAEFQQVSPAEQQSAMQTIKDLQAQIPVFEKQVADADAMFKQNEPMMQQNIKDRKMNTQMKGGDLARIQELAGLKEDETSPRFMGYQKTQHDNGDTTDDYSQGPLAVKVRKDAKGNTVSSDAQYNIGPDQVQMNRNQVGVNTLTAQGPNADNIVSANASAQRKGVDPARFAAFQKQTTTQEQAGAPMSYADILKSIQQGGKMSTNVPPSIPMKQGDLGNLQKKAPPAPEEDPTTALNRYKKEQEAAWNAMSPEEKARRNQRESAVKQKTADDRLLDQMVTIARLR